MANDAKGVVDKSEDKNEIKKAQDEQRVKEEEFLNELVGEQADKEKTEDAEEAEEAETEEKESEETEESEGEEKEEEAEGEESQEESEEEPDSENSATQRRIDELTRKNKILERELAAARGEKAEAKDSDTEKLEKMSVDELKNLRRELRLNSRTEKDEAKVRRYIELEEKIDDVIQSAPQRFERNQLAQYQAAVRETSEELGKAFTQDIQTKIFSKAKAIFEKSPTLQRAVDGQATAWSLAVDWYNDTSKLSTKANRSAELERDVNKLKKKVTLDGALRAGANKENEQHRLYKKAKGGDKNAENKWIAKELGL